MARANDEVEALLYEYTELLSILSEDRFKPRAYEKAARAVGGHPDDISGFDVEQLMGIPTVGKSIAEKIHEYLSTGEIKALEELRSEIPGGVRKLMAVPGLGPKKAVLLYKDLGIESVEDLKAAIEEGRLSGLKGFGKKTEENILRGLQNVRRAGDRVRLGEALDMAEEMLARLSELHEVKRTEYAGSLRRMCETIGDIDLLVASEKPGPVMEAFTSLPRVDRVLGSGETKASIVTTKGMQIDLRVVTPDVWGAALQYFTGSKAHNVRVREIAVRKGLKLSEYGLFQAKSGKLIVAETEEDVYGELGLPWIPPTLREDRGEIEAALAGELPSVIELKQMKGDLHTHTNLTDGLAPLEKMLEAAAGLKYKYYAVTDHAPDLAMQRMTDEKMLAQRRQLRSLASKHEMTLLHGSELNIGPEGSVDWPGEFLSGFDVLVASVHSHFNQSKDEMTRRIVTAMENPFVNVIGHPTARRIGKRPPIEFDLDEVFKAAARTGTALEVNSYPERLDLKDEHVLWAKRRGVKFAIDTDAHSPVHLSFMRYGVATGQRGWLTKDDVINAWPLAKLRKFLRKAGQD
ncbi:MAG: DNA polymerase/3'-5' exonuclease PolX [Actinomycetota bacterium]